ncbi:AzlC family ABC transporter permease [Halorussus caseinilyticus]|uniref:AzlC family ABC transporter permease n=1 Tax=Halorussus caseinilyticus TaxID=3034025 RepID=A0ABD5WQ80_9EURY|nr:AzlC family ABC transporter permease [Halorussus sp. DT72]
MSDERIRFSVAGVTSGVKSSLPIAVSVATYGLVFGVLARQTTLGPAETLLMSATVFAASAQFVALDLWGRNLPSVTIVVTTFLVNLRHLLMGASLRPWLSRLSSGKVYGMLFFLNDESWGITMSEHADGERDGAFLLGSGLIVFVAWVGASLLGVTAGSLIRNPARYGLDFAFIAVYIALLVGVWDDRGDALPVGTAAVVAVGAAYLLPGEWHIILGGLVGSVVGVVRDSYV